MMVAYTVNSEPVWSHEQPRSSHIPGKAKSRNCRRLKLATRDCALPHVRRGLAAANCACRDYLHPRT